MALAAGAVATWLGLSFVSERLESEASRVVFGEGRVFSAHVDDALPKARRARRLQPDAEPRLLEWALLHRAGRLRESEAVLEQLLAEEPKNAQAWLALTRTTREPRLASQARRRFRALQPR